MNSPQKISPKELLSRYQAGERNFAGIRLLEPNDDPEALCGADLSEIILSGAYLPGVKLREVNLSGSLMIGVYLPDADLTLADLKKSDLRGATLKRACLEYVDLRCAILNGANLIQANLLGADLTDASLDYSCLAQVDFSQLCLSNPLYSDCIDAMRVEGPMVWQTTLPGGSVEVEAKYYYVD
jgi:uncharacterized protein YjbI with pentapeptide repeats